MPKAKYSHLDDTEAPAGADADAALLAAATARGESTLEMVELALDDDDDDDDDGAGHLRREEELEAARTLQGMMFMGLSTVFLSLMSIQIKVLVELYEYGPLQLVFARSAIQWVLTNIMLRYLGISPFGERDLRVLLTARGVIGGVALACYYSSLTTLILSDAVTLNFLTPVFAAIFASLFLGERWEATDRAAAAVSMVGVVCISRPTFLGFPGEDDDGDGDADEEDNLERLTYVGIGITGAILAGAVYVVVRKVGMRAHALQFVNYFSMAAMALTLPTSLVLEEIVRPPTPSAWALLFGSGVSAFVAQVLLNRALQAGKTAKVSVMNYARMPLSFIWQLLFLSTVPDPWSIAGALLIASTAVATLYKDYRKRQQASRR